jgi:hypothetical protein
MKRYELVRFECGKYGVKIVNTTGRFLYLEPFGIDLDCYTDRDINKYCKTRFRWRAELKMAKRIRYDKMISTSCKVIIDNE